MAGSVVMVLEWFLCWRVGATRIVFKSMVLILGEGGDKRGTSFVVGVSEVCTCFCLFSLLSKITPTISLSHNCQSRSVPRDLCYQSLSSTCNHLTSK